MKKQKAKPSSFLQSTCPCTATNKPKTKVWGTATYVIRYERYKGGEIKPLIHKCHALKQGALAEKLLQPLPLAGEDADFGKADVFPDAAVDF